MLRRSQGLKRGTKGLKRGEALRRYKRMPRVSRRRRKECASYPDFRRRQMRLHPFCQLWLIERGIGPDMERRIVAAYHDECGVLGRFTVDGEVPPLSVEIHHRNKARGERLTDERWTMCVSREAHERIEANKDWARDQGYLLPFEADADGRTPGGEQGLTTEELMKKNARDAK